MDAARRRFLLSAATLGVTSLAGGRSANARSASQANSERADSPFSYRRNWGRWGENDEKGAVNLITPQKRTGAAALVRTGRAVSLSRVFAPDQQYVRVSERGGGGSVVDYYGSLYHGVNVTHVD